VDRTRLEAVKQCFYGFRDQTQGHKNGSRHLLGLLSFSDKIVIHTNPTANFDVFEDVIDDMTSKGRTAIYEAVSVACNQILRPISQLHPKADLRVLVLSDGMNNCNSVNPNQALKALGDVGAVCDCMILGDNKNSADDDLRRLVAASEGQCVQFTGLADAYEALESPAMISLASRRNSDVAVDREAFRSRIAAVPTIAKVAAAPIQKTVKKAKAAPEPTASKVASYIALDTNFNNLKQGNGAVGKRVLKELTTFAKNPTPNMFLYPGLTAEGNVSESLRVLMVGHQDHPIFKGHSWQINIEFPPSYPFVPPRFRCVTPIYHYAVSADGDVCLEVLKSAWSPASTVQGILEQFSQLIHEPKTVDPDCNLAIRSWLSDLLRTNPEEYDVQTLRQTKENALALPPHLENKKVTSITGNDLFSFLV
jgi:ubiquitin-protein ligase